MMPNDLRCDLFELVVCVRHGIGFGGYLEKAQVVVPISKGDDLRVACMLCNVTDTVSL